MIIENTFEANHAMYNPCCESSRFTSQNPEKQAGLRAYAVDLAGWHSTRARPRGPDVIMEAKNKEDALVLTGIQL